MYTTEDVNPYPHISPRVSHCSTCLHLSNLINIWGVWWSLVCQGFGDAKEGSRFCSLEVIDEEAWIDQIG